MMKTFLIIMSLLTTLNIFALDLEETTNTFHERMIQRTPNYFDNVEIHLLDKVPVQIEQLAAANLFSLVSFAISLDLFNQGFSYHLNEDIYEVLNSQGKAIAYTFSIMILKDGVISTIAMYEAVRRVDGVFYISRDPAYYGK